MSNIIDVKNLTIGYDGMSIQENLSFSVKRGEIFIILGGSGCGKSTLLKHLIGLNNPMSGEISIFDTSITKCEEDDKRQLMKKFGVLYQSGALFGSLTLAENISLLLEEYTDFSKKERESVIKEKLSLVDLDGYENYYPAEISGGMKKRAGLARAMALNPELLFFDEPSAGLDPISAALLDKLIISLRDNYQTTMVIVTHELDSIFAIADRVIMLDKETKSIIATGNPHKLKENPPNEWVKDFLTRTGFGR